MPPKEKPRNFVGYRIPPDIEKKVDALIESKEFDNKADIISIALRFWFENKDKLTQTDEFKKWLVSEDGEHYIKNLIQKVMNEE